MTQRKVLFIDTSLSGLSGDMFLSSFIDMGFPNNSLNNIFAMVNNVYPKNRFKGFKVSSTKRNGVYAKTLVTEIINSENDMKGLELKAVLDSCLKKLNLKELYAEYALKVIETLIDSERRVHGSEEADIQFHELSSPDTLFDVLGVASALQYFSVLEDTVVYSTPIPVGKGIINFSHGQCNIPSPAVLDILQKYEVPFHLGPVEGELLTPTGVSLLVNLKPIFSEPPLNFVIESKGYGAGNRLMGHFPNMLRVISARIIDSREKRGFDSDFVVLLETNVDDVSGERVGYAIQQLMKAGALDVCAVPTIMKKSRSGFNIQVMVPLRLEEKLVGSLFDCTDTLGVRRSVYQRYKLKRELDKLKIRIRGKVYEVRVKKIYGNDGRVRYKPEFEDVVKVSEEVKEPIRDVFSIIYRALE